MNREEFDKIIESNPEAKFKVIKDDEHYFSLGDEITFEGHDIEDEDGLLLLFNDGEDLQYLRLDQIELIVESVVQPLKLKFPCCIATSEIEDGETFSKVKELLIASGAVDCGESWRDFSHFPYYGVDEEDGKSELKFWKLASNYSPTLDEYTVTVYTLEDLFPEVTEETVEDSHPWTEWDCNNFETPPIEVGAVADIKWRDGSESIGITYKSGESVGGRGYLLSSWADCYEATVVAYRLHKGASVALQDSAQDVLAESNTQGTAIAQDDVQATTEPFKVVKHTYYDVTIKGEEYRFTKEEANLLCTLLVEAIGEDYEPI